MLYFLWDLGLKIGHSSRSLDDMVRMSKSDLTIRTAMLEGRYVWGDQDLYEEARQRFWTDVVSGTQRQFVVEQLDDREDRHKRMGDSRHDAQPHGQEDTEWMR